MGITLYDLNAQRAMLKRGEEKRKAARQAEERERLRDTFAAAALTGLLANGDYNPSTPVLAFRMADAMLRERGNHSEKPNGSTNHDAAPDARAESDEARTDKAATSHRREGTGNTPSKAEIDALEFVVEEGRIGNYGILRSWLIRLRPEWESQSYEKSEENG
jgi:hypothetical protein